MRILLLTFFLFLIAIPVQTQEISFESGLWFSGPIVEEKTDRVRLGNMGQDMHFSVQISDWISDHWRVGGEFLLTPTHIYVYPATEGNDGWFSRPSGASRKEPILWSCSTAGPWYDKGWVDVGIGAGLCHMSSADYSFFGAAPLHSFSTRADVGFSYALTDNLSSSFRCRVHPTRVGGKDYTVLQIASGELKPGEHDSNRTVWYFSGGCGLSFDVKLP